MDEVRKIDTDIHIQVNTSNTVNGKKQQNSFILNAIS
jgi:hypothetical protein